MFDCTIKLLTPRTITRIQDGEQLFHLFLKHFPDYAPQSCGEAEPAGDRFSTNEVVTSLNCWGRSEYIAKRESPLLVMRVGFAGPDATWRHTSVSFIQFQLSLASDLLRLKTFVLELAESFEADYAMAHILTLRELNDWMECRFQGPPAWHEPPVEKMIARLRMMVDRDGFASVLWGTEIASLHTVKLQKCLPNVYWLNVFGAPYLEIFGKERLLSVPAYSIDHLAYGGVAVNVSKDLTDTDESWKYYKTVRDLCRSHLDCNVFCDSKAAKGHRYRTPEFTATPMRVIH
jgi:hypothetical protein